MITTYNTYLKENKKYTFNDLLSECFNTYTIYMYFNNNTSKNIIVIDSPDYVSFDEKNNYYNDIEFNWYYNYDKIIKIINNEICKVLNINDLSNVPLDKFLLFRYLVMNFHKKFGWGDVEKEDLYIKIYLYGTNVNILSGNLHECFANLKKFNFNISNYVEFLCKNDKKIFTNEYFIDLITNVDYLNNKYKHYIDANKFNLI